MKKIEIIQNINMGSAMNIGKDQIDIRHIRYFISAANSGSFRKAAVALGVQESSVSRRIRDIEDQIGASLFVRHSGGINLTMAGQRFLHRARHALDHIRDGAAEVAAIGRAEGGYLKVGLFSSLSSGFLSALFRAYDARHGSVHIDFVEGEAHQCPSPISDRYRLCHWAERFWRVRLGLPLVV
ncbi:LysR family transcriptional regulator [Xanthobacter autotrophicus]|uniref:LysR family transcriptional regulator n=1 Tax=Xanthobacter autotrophicus TaxID=280 RepID=UPI00372C5277